MRCYSVFKVRKIALGFILLLLLFSIMVSTPEIKMVNASEIIYFTLGLTGTLREQIKSSVSEAFILL